MGEEKNWWTEEGKAVTKYKNELDLYRTQKSLQKPENQSLIILSKLSKQVWIIKQTRFSRLELIWNLAILCDLCILCGLTDSEKR